MLILTKAVLSMMIGFILSIVFGFILIPILKKLKARNKVSIFLAKEHAAKNGTPTMGGLIFIIPTIVTTLLLIYMGKINLSSNLLIVLFVFVAYALLGLLDDILSITKKTKYLNEGLTELQKLTIEILIALAFFYIYIQNGGDSTFDIYTLGIKINMGWAYGLFLLFVLVGSSNAVNLTDGLDGLAGGLSMIAFLAFGIISWGSSWVTGSQDMAIFCFILVGSLLGFLFYNDYPAKVFMGDTGALALGASLATVAILTNHEGTLIIVAGVFIIETLSSIIQIFSIKLFKKKVFLMAPIHHHFEKLGWAERDIVKMFYVIGLILSMAAIAFGVWI